MENISQHWAIIINPKSGKRKYKKQSNNLFALLKLHNIQFEFRITRFAGHATKIAKYFVEHNFKNILILGGDGTISEVINGIFSANIENTSDIKIALIPRGTGNDWGRFWGLTQNFQKSTNTFINGKTQMIDIGRVSYMIEGETENHYFINSIGFGLDAAVVNLTHKLKEIFGSHSFMYTVSLLLAVFSYRAHKVNIHAKEKTSPIICSL